MANSWEYDLAKMFTDRDNPTVTPLGACIGAVTSLNPPQVTLQDGNFVIQGEQLYICYHLLERDTDYDNMSLSGDLNHQCSHPCTGSYNASASGHIKLKEVWKVGDLVLVIPSQSEQQFFVVDVIRKINGCNNHAE